MEPKLIYAQICRRTVFKTVLHILKRSYISIYISNIIIWTLLGLILVFLQLFIAHSFTSKNTKEVLSLFLYEIINKTNM